ncbi:MAG: AzlD domain-containing protein [Moraxella sp.]|nr:AzlD domain-containing protein [Moraxella sp.]
MFSQANVSTLVIAVVAMAILTALSRTLPFLLPDNSPIIRFFTAENSPLAPLGGAIIVTMTMVLMLPFFETPTEHSPMTATICGIVATAIATTKKINTGMSVIIGMVGFLIGSLVYSMF